MTPGGDDLLHDHIDDDLEVLIDDLTDAQVCKFNFFKCLAHYLNGCCISNRKHKAVKLAILAEARTYVWSPGPMKRAKQEDIIMRKNLHIVNNIEDEPFENKPVCDAMHTNYKRSKKGGGALLPFSIGTRRWNLTISAKFWQNFRELAICPNYLGVQLRLGT